MSGCVPFNEAYITATHAMDGTPFPIFDTTDHDSFSFDYCAGTHPYRTDIRTATERAEQPGTRPVASGDGFDDRTTLFLGHRLVECEEASGSASSLGHVQAQLSPLPSALVSLLS